MPLRALAACAYVALAVGILVGRRPDAVLNPQFWAEDGNAYFADAYNRGLDSLLAPRVGYLVVTARLTALLAQPLGLAAAPALFNLVGLALQLAPALLILSSRFERAIPSLWVRGLLGIAYLLVPSAEVHATLTNAPWHLAILMIMVVIAAPPRGLAWRCFDLAVLGLGGLTGPLALLVAPLALVRWLVTRHRWHGVLTAVGAVVALGQLQVIRGGSREAAELSAGLSSELGADPRSLIRILADRVIVPGLTGEQNAAIFSVHWWHGLLWASLLVLATLGLAGFAALRGPVELRILMAFSALTLTVSLLHPLVARRGPQWPPMVSSEAGMRYFLIPTVGFTVLVIWGISRLPPAPRAVAGGLFALILLCGAAAHPQYPALPDRQPSVQASRLDAAPRGRVVDFPLNPAGWSMSLRKH